MQKLFFPAALASAAVGQNTNNITNPNIISLLNVAATKPDLSAAVGYFSKIAPLLGDFSNVTVFAPNDAAFATYVETPTAHEEDTNPALVKAIFGYRILQGVHRHFKPEVFIHSTLQPGPFANVTGGQNLQTFGIDLYSGPLANSTIVGEALSFSGGVIFPINKVLILPQNLSLTAETLNLTAALGAIQDTKSASLIEQSKDVTLFIPNNRAFQRSASSLARLNATELAAVISYHAVVGSVSFSTNIPDHGVTLKNINGQSINVRRSNGRIYVNGARAATPDVLIANGVIHVIDEVLDPRNTYQAPTSEHGHHCKFPSCNCP